MRTDINGNFVFETGSFLLSVDKSSIAQSLIFKPAKEECLAQGENIPLFSVVQSRPFHNEIKLAYPNKRTVYPANRLREEEGRLIVGFEIVPYEAVVSVKEQEHYLSFTLSDFIPHSELYGGMLKDLPPVEEFRILQLPVKNREVFGQWLNVMTGTGVSISVLGTSEFTRIDSEARKNCRILYADCVKSVKLKGVGAALIVSRENDLLSCIDKVERDYSLPLGAESRRSGRINSSIYWVYDITPDNVDDHIRYARQGGFSEMLIFMEPLIGSHGYDYDKTGDNRLVPPFSENGNLQKMLQKIKAAGISPGLHFLHTFIGYHSSYVSPAADPRLHLLRHFTLSKPIGKNECTDTVFVNEDPRESPMADGVRILKFGSELISYEGYTETPPYRFTGCRRGAWETTPVDHPLHEIGGILDVCEYGGRNAYIDQTTDLQDEVAQKIAEIYELGFEFVYFDGSEGTMAPYEFNVPNAQYRVLKKLKNPPFMTMGAAKAHFSWHFLSGGNAFDVFPPDVFKKMIDKYPLEEAARVRADKTVVNFGWWLLWNIDKDTFGTQPDMFEYGTSRAAGFECPATVMFDLETLKTHPRTDDCLEVMRRWEEVRKKDLLDEKQKEALQKPGHEHILLLNERREYELVPYRYIDCSENVPVREFRAFAFERGGCSWIVYWHPTGSGKVLLPQNDVTLYEELYLDPLKTEIVSDGTVLPVGKRRYIKSARPLEELIAAVKTIKGL